MTGHSASPSSTSTISRSSTTTTGTRAATSVLRGVAQILAGNLRASDIIGRYGGEEFMLVLDRDERRGRRHRSPRSFARWSSANGSTSRATPDLSVTISIGIVGGDRISSSGWRRSFGMPTPRCTRPSRSVATRPTSSPSRTRTPVSRGRRSRVPGARTRWRSAAGLARRPRTSSRRSSPRSPITAGSHRR